MLARLFGRGRAPDRLGADRQRLGTDLLTLEINTIVKHGITAERMPVLPHALLDIMQEYIALLQTGPGVGADEMERFLLEDAKASVIVPALPEADAALADALSPEATARHLERLRRRLRANLDTFSGLRQAAITALARTEAAIAAGSTLRPRGRDDELARRAVLLNRVVNNIETLQDVLKRLTDQRLIDDLQLTREQLAAKFDARIPTDKPEAERLMVLGPYDVVPSDYLALRKVWEVGTEEIVAQTAISLDGDIVTRVTPLLLRAEGKPLLDIHERAVNTSVSYWKGLVDTLLAVVGQAIGAFFGSRK